MHLDTEVLPAFALENFGSLRVICSLLAQTFVK